jgi:hypothetical protein
MHKNMIDKGLKSIQKIHENMDSIGQQILELEHEKEGVAGQLESINSLLKKIQQPIS